MKRFIKFFWYLLRLKNYSYSQKDRIEDGIKTIYDGALKLLNKNSIEYKEIDEKNAGAWKKLAEL